LGADQRGGRGVLGHQRRRHVGARVDLRLLSQPGAVVPDHPRVLRGVITPERTLVPGTCVRGGERPPRHRRQSGSFMSSASSATCRCALLIATATRTFPSNTASLGFCRASDKLFLALAIDSLAS